MWAKINVVIRLSIVEQKALWFTCGLCFNFPFCFEQCLYGTLGLVDVSFGLHLLWNLGSTYENSKKPVCVKYEIYFKRELSWVS